MKTDEKILNDMETEKIEEKLSSEVREEFANSTMTKAGRLAMELNAERKRLKQELAEQLTVMLNGLLLSLQSVACLL